MSKEAEVAQGKNIADACKAAGVEHFIWSSLAHASKSKVASRCLIDVSDLPLSQWREIGTHGSLRLES